MTRISPQTITERAAFWGRPEDRIWRDLILPVNGGAKAGQRGGRGASSSMPTPQSGLVLRRPVGRLLLRR